MSLTYHLVQRPDKSEGALEGSKLYYGQIKIRQQVDFDTLCERIADRSTASKGDVMVVIDGRCDGGHRWIDQGINYRTSGWEQRTDGRIWEFPFECR